MKKNILLIEDDQNIAIALCTILQREGYQVEVVKRWRDIHEQIHLSPPDLILLDLIFPDMDGFDVCRNIRNDVKGENIPILILSSRGEDSDVVAGLELGADDYIIKPINPKVLLARVRVVLRRKEMQFAHNREILRYDDFSIDPHRFEVKYRNSDLLLTRSEFRILQLFCSRPGCVFSRHQVIEAVHGERTPVTARSVDVLIAGLRQKLGRQKQIIETVRGIGYRIKRLSEHIEREPKEEPLEHIG